MATLVIATSPYGHGSDDAQRRDYSKGGGDMAMKSKVQNSGSKQFASGGKTKMFGKQHAGPQKSGVTDHTVGGSGKFATGGRTKMFGKQHAGAARRGETGK